MDSATKEELVADLTKVIGDLEKYAVALRDAMIEHRTKDIWDAVAGQESVLGEIEKIKTRIEALNRGGESQDAPAPGDDSRSKLRRLFEKVRMIQSVNRRLAGVYLDVVDRTFAKLSDAARPRGLTYGSSGSVERVMAPMFVQQTG